ncbi:MAG: hypothetical protein ACTSPB_00120 [Candidatus Thorarchaeota archaeon]
MLRCNICGFVAEDDVVLEHIDDEHKEEFFDEMYGVWKNNQVEEVYNSGED